MDNTEDKTQIEFEEIVDKKTKHSEVILDDSTDSATGTVIIDFTNTEGSMDYTKQSSEKYKEDEVKEELNKKSLNEIREEIKKEEEAQVSNMSLSDFKDISKFLIFFVDTVFSSFFKWWSGDTSDAAYSLNEKKKDMLSHQLSLILVKHQVKMRIEMLFFVSLIVVYIPAFMKAKEFKKNKRLDEEKENEKINRINELKRKSILEKNAVHIQSNNKINDVKKDDVKKDNYIEKNDTNNNDVNNGNLIEPVIMVVDETKKQIKTRRKRGNPGKA